MILLVSCHRELGKGKETYISQDPLDAAASFLQIRPLGTSYPPHIRPSDSDIAGCIDPSDSDIAGLSIDDLSIADLDHTVC